MIDYELARKLKDAGFPQGKTRDVICKHGFSSEWTEFKEDGCPTYERVGLPSLEELIETCMPLIEDCLHINGTKEHGWVAVDGRDGFGIYSGEGSTPSEAVVNLYLALNEKKV